MAIFLDFLTAQSLAVQPAKAACIEYPREAGKDEQYPWLCSAKAALVADSTVGVRSGPSREAFMALVHMASVQVRGGGVAGRVMAAVPDTPAVYAVACIRV
jgi:hypothetical protein